MYYINSAVWNKCNNTSKVNLKSYFKDHQNYTDLSHFVALLSFGQRKFSWSVTWHLKLYVIKQDLTKKWQVGFSHGVLKMWNCYIASANCDTASDLYGAELMSSASNNGERFSACGLQAILCWWQNGEHLLLEVNSIIQ